MTARILVVDDEDPIRGLVAGYLREEGFVVEEAADGQAAVERFDREPPIDLAVLDVRMPRLDGIEALREIRRRSDCYVIMLTAAAEETDRVIGLSVGADDYVAKPFSPREFVARVKAVLRRRRPADAAEDRLPPAAPAQRYALADGGSFVLDIDRHEVLLDDSAVELTALQFELLGVLASSPGRVFARHQLIERVWGRDFFGEERIVDVHVGNLRKALGEGASDARVVGTVRGVGYRFLPEPVGRS